MQTTIAIVADRYSNYWRPVIERISARLELAGFATLFITSRDFYKPSLEKPEAKLWNNTIFSASRHFPVQGYIVLNTSSSCDNAIERVAEFAHGVDQKPVISIGADIPGIVSVLPDNVSGMGNLMDHMTSDSTRQNYVFLRGGLNLGVSQERESIFRKVLASKGIPIQQDLIIDGGLTSQSAFSAMLSALQCRQDIHAVVAANDVLAVGAILAIQEHGLSVPEDVMVSGYDDREIADNSFPSLTSVSYRFSNLAEYAVDALLVMLNEDDTDVTIQSCELEDSRLQVCSSSCARDSVIPATVNNDTLRQDNALQQKVNFEKERARKMQDDLHIEIASCNTFEELDDLLDRSAVKLSLSRLFLVLHEQKAERKQLQAHKVISYGIRGRHCSDIKYNANDILPPDMAYELAVGLLVLAPIPDGVKTLGFLLLDPSSVTALSIENLASCIGKVLGGFIQVQAYEAQRVDLQQKNTSLRYMANHDELTGLENRSGFTRRLVQKLKNVENRQFTLELLLIGLDDFKAVNDTFGHEFGDVVLKEVANRIIAVLRDTDHSARFGSDEFAILIESDAGALSAALVAGRVLTALNTPLNVAGTQIELGASIGISRLGHGPNEGPDVSQLLKQSDTALYQAKAAGKNCYLHYADCMLTSLHRRLKLENAIKHALSNKEFTFEYQPRVNVVTRMIQGFEALVRWNPERDDLQADDISPGTFIPVAEASGLISEIDKLALIQACKQLKSWQEEGLRTCISVNMSVKRLQQPDLVDEVRETIDFYGIAPGMIELELTESAAMDDISKNVITLKQLRLLGVNISIDDFGTGYSSLAYLKKLPLTCLKIDKSFLKGIVENNCISSDAQIIKTIIALGKSMGYTLVAEGVERPEQTRFLISHGCTQAQGFLYSKSLTSCAATSQLIRSKSGQAVGGGTV